MKKANIVFVVVLLLSIANLGYTKSNESVLLTRNFKQCNEKNIIFICTGYKNEDGVNIYHLEDNNDFSKECKGTNCEHDMQQCIYNYIISNCTNAEPIIAKNFSTNFAKIAKYNFENYILNNKTDFANISSVEGNDGTVYYYAYNILRGLYFVYYFETPDQPVNILSFNELYQSYQYNITAIKNSKAIKENFDRILWLIKNSGTDMGPTPSILMHPRPPYDNQDMLCYLYFNNKLNDYVKIDKSVAEKISKIFTLGLPQKESIKSIKGDDLQFYKIESRKKSVKINYTEKPTYNYDNMDLFVFTTLNGNVASMSTNMTGTPHEGEIIEFQFIDDGASRTINWGEKFKDGNTNIPNTTNPRKTLVVIFQYTGNLWMCNETFNVD